MSLNYVSIDYQVQLVLVNKLVSTINYQKCIHITESTLSGILSTADVVKLRAAQLMCSPVGLKIAL